MIRLRGGGREDYYERLQQPLKRELLTEATNRRDQDLLKRALVEAKDAGVSRYDGEYIKAEKELQMVESRKALQNALANRDPLEIRRVIAVISRKSASMYYLQHDIIDAEREADRLERLQMHRGTVLHMDKNAMTEMRRYHKPPALVHKIMQGVMLLFDIDEQQSSNWKVCQQYLNPYGREGLNKKIVDFNHESVYPEIASRCREILEDYCLEDVQDVSPALATFYVWALGVVDEVESHHSSHGMRPASIRQQKAIFRAKTMERLAASPRRSFSY